MAQEMQPGPEDRSRRKTAVRHGACQAASVVEDHDDEGRGDKDQQWAHAQEVDGEPGAGDQGEDPAFDCGPCQSHDRVRDDRDNHGLDAE